MTDEDLRVDEELAIGNKKSKDDFKEYLLNRVGYFYPGHYKLTMEDVLSNETRCLILDIIMDNPGIHYKGVYKKANTSVSNLNWHLDILETYKIINREKFGNYLIFYAYKTENPLKESNPKIMKSRRTLDILDIVGENPGIQQNQIAEIIGLNRKTVKYHLDKLVDAKMIQIISAGRSNNVYLRTAFTNRRLRKDHVISD